MPENTCPITHQPMPDGFVIHPDCGIQLAGKLGMLPLHMEALQALLRKEVKQGESAGVNTPTQNPAPINLTMLENQFIIENTLTTWAKEIGKATSTTPPTTWANYPKYFQTHASQICRLAEGATLFDEMLHALRFLERVVEYRPQRIFAGQCGECGSYVYVKSDVVVAVCNQCGASWDVDSSRGMMMNELRECWLTAGEALAVVGFFCEPPKREGLRKLVARGRVERRGDGVRALYMPAQIIEVCS